MAKKEKIEILGLELFNELKNEMYIVEAIQKHLDLGIGWHYYLDLAWMVNEIKNLPKGSLILDAGAGGGLSQFILSELGFNVVSVDFTSRDFSQNKRYSGVSYNLNDQHEIFDNRYTRHLEKTYNIGFKKRIRKIINFISRPSGATTVAEAIKIIQKQILVQAENHDFLKGNPERTCGRIFLYKSDLKNMKLIPDSFCDAAVSISALEHNDHDDFRGCVQEILRIIKPGGAMNVTISASNGADYFHEPSKGWCYSEETMKKLFNLVDETESNFQQREKLYAQLRQDGNELHKRLAPFYFKSGANGMPWGKWDPQYMPVGVVKIRKA